MRLLIESYRVQQAAWPESGRHILAQFDPVSVVVYQAFRPEIAEYAVRHGRFGGDFSFDRMSWIKPNFLWMMYRSGWGTKRDQEVTLAIRLPREVFEKLLRDAVHSTFVPDVYSDAQDWRDAVASSSVRLQWDPDHDPRGRPLARRAIQLGLRGETLRQFATEWITGIEDISAFVAEQRKNRDDVEASPLLLPRERVLEISDPVASKRLQLD